MVVALHNAATWFMTGLIWTIQLVHYPMFSMLRESTFRESHRRHARRITWIVGPAMILEMATALSLFIERAPGDPAAVAGLSLVAVIWIVTGFVIVPIHGRLQRGPDPALVVSLVRWNWIRTAAWSVRGAICLLCL